MSVLKSCPFCGTMPIEDEWISGDKKYYWVHCDNDQCRIQPSTDYHISKAVVVREWNRRVEE